MYTMLYIGVYAFEAAQRRSIEIVKIFNFWIFLAGQNVFTEENIIYNLYKHLWFQRTRSIFPNTLTQFRRSEGIDHQLKM